MFRVIFFIIIAFALTACSGGGSTPPACDSTAQPAYLYRSGTTHLEVYQPASCSYEPLFIKGVNLGIATPGKYAGDLESAATKADFLRWFQQMADAGINVVRVYTLQMDFFYQALHEFNTNRESQGKTPLYLSHGIWLDEEYDETDFNGNMVIDTEEFRGLYATDLETRFSTNISEVVNAIHGNITLAAGAPRFGKAYGVYTFDISKWVLAWIIGREVHPDEVELTNDGTPGTTSYNGIYLSLATGTPTEAWVTARMDEVLSLEKNNYGDERPISFSSWPTLDPLTHTTEHLVGNNDYEDSQQIDLANIDSSKAPAGVFYSFHAYPYYPDFISEDPDYRTYTDADSTPNSYLGYLNQLKNHYSGRPVIIAEFSVPSSWGNVHTAHSGMHHGGHDETTQGVYGARMLQNIHDSNMGGGMLFAWIDEWWKPTWLTNEFDFPFNRRAYWHNIMAPEQNYGLLGFIPDTSAMDYYTPLTQYGGAPWNGSNVTSISAAADTTYYRLQLDLAAPLTNSDHIILALDTYGDSLVDKRGEDTITSTTTTPVNNIAGSVITAQQSEFFLHLYNVSGQWKAQLYVGSEYDLYGLYGGEHNPALQSPTVPTGVWNAVKWKNNYVDYSGAGYSSFYDITTNVEFNAGELKVRDLGGTPNSKDAVILSSTQIEIRLPWGLLQFSDPAQHLVFHDDKGTASTWQDPYTTTGIAQAVVFNNSPEGESNRYIWNKWMTDPTLPPASQTEPIPAHTEVLKQSYEIYKNAIANIGN